MSFFLGLFNKVNSERIIKNKKHWRLPDWWKIESLDVNDIIDAWDFGYEGHRTSKEVRTGMQYGIEFTVRAGSPLERIGEGVYFNGSSSMNIYAHTLAEIDWNEVSVIIEFYDIVQNNPTLDAFFSHYTDTCHYTLQNGWDIDKLRWSSGGTDSSTIEVGNAMYEGVIGVSGGNIYANGVKIGEVLDSTSAEENGDFVLGCIRTEGQRNIQFIRGIVKKILITKRKLTDTEQWEIYSKITGSICHKPEDELLRNPSFDCGLAYWGYHPTFPAELTNNNNGSIHIKALNNYSSLEPIDTITGNGFPSGEYILKVEVANIVGNGKVSFKTNDWSGNFPLANGTNIIAFDSNGRDITRLAIGANNDVTFEADILSVSLKKTDSYKVTYRGLDVTNNNDLVYHI